jgi:hypothetical protein
VSQNLLRDPFVVSGPTRTGVGNGILVIDKLTHFTTAQTYTATCISKSPDVIFSVVGSVDGPIGIATQGLQFFDEDLKVFLTIAAGATAFEVGDQFVFAVASGTDLHQDNIDLYDEIPQKNFGAGTKGSSSGDHNIRFKDISVGAYLYVQDLKYNAVTLGPNGNNVQVQYFDYLEGGAAQLTIQNLHYTCKEVDQGASGNNIGIEYINYTPAVKAQVTIQDLRYKALTPGVGGNSITVRYINDGTAGSETVGVSGNAITVHIQSGVSTATQVKTAVEASSAAMALLDNPVTITGTGSNPQTTQGPTNLAGGANAIGDAGNEIVTWDFARPGYDAVMSVTCQTGVSTATQIKTKVDADSTAADVFVVTVIGGPGSTAQTAPVTVAHLAGGFDSVGKLQVDVIVVGSLIKVYFNDAVYTANDIKAAVDASTAAAALATVAVTGSGTKVQSAPVALANLSGGLTKFFVLDTKELTDSANFHEGNASLKLQELIILGGVEVAKHAHFKDVVSMSASNSTPVNDAQKAINDVTDRSVIEMRNERQDRNCYLVGGGNWSWNESTSTLTWSADAYLAIPGREIAYMPIQAGSVVIAVGRGAYVSIQRTGGATSYLPITVDNLVSIPENDTIFMFAWAQTAPLGGGVFVRSMYLRDGDQRKLYESGGSVERQNLNALLIAGGNWSWTLSTNTLTWTADAYVQIPGLQNARNKIVAGTNTNLTADGMALIASINRTAGADNSISVSSATVSTMTQNDAYFIIARRVGNAIIVGQDTLLVDGASPTPIGSGGSDAASKSLNNLTTTSINQDLLPSADNTRSFGSNVLGWLTGWFANIIAPYASQPHAEDGRGRNRRCESRPVAS